MIVSSMKMVPAFSKFTIVADEGTEEEMVYTMLDGRWEEGETDIGPLVNVTREGLYGYVVLRDIWGPVRIVSPV